jgi:hypothetical protein
MRSPVGLRIVAALAVVQGVLGILRALQWLEIGSDLSRTGLVLLPMLGLAALARGVLVAAIAVPYLLFALGALTGRRWARGVGLAACVVNVLAVVTLALAGESLAAALFWVVVPLIVGAYLLGPGRGAPAGA